MMGKADMSPPLPQDNRVWKCREHRLEIRSRPLLMGILNATPDSFSDGGLYSSAEDAIERALAMAEDGADIVDIGGESTRPNAAPVGADEEMRRVLPVISGIAGRASALISVDTSKAAVAEACLEAGAHIINDVSAFTADPRMREVALRFGAGMVLMHRKGDPATMQVDPHYNNVVAEVRDFLSSRLRDLAAAGIDFETMVIDPGIGFGKTLEHNLKLVANLESLAGLGRPVAVGMSRKSFLGRLTERGVSERLAASLGVLAYSALRGASILRVHDVRESRDVLACLEALAAEET